MPLPKATAIFASLLIFVGAISTAQAQRLSSVFQTITFGVHRTPSSVERALRAMQNSNPSRLPRLFQSLTVPGNDVFKITISEGEIRPDETSYLGRRTVRISPQPDNFRLPSLTEGGRIQKDVEALPDGDSQHQTSGIPFIITITD